MSTLFHTRSRTTHRSPGSRFMLMSGILAATACFATVAEADETDVTSQDEGGGGTATGTGPAAKAAPVTKVTEATIATVEPHAALQELIKNYDEVKEKATSYMCDQAELIAKENIGRPVIIKTLMVARGVTLETAQSTASRMITLSKSPEKIAGLRDGSLTIRETVYGRAKPGTTEAATGGAEGGQPGTATTKKTDTEKKEDKYNRLLKEFTESAKASGFDLKSIIAGVTASLKDAGIK